jgi:hypothetical protein
MDARDSAVRLVEDGFVNAEYMLTACLKWMSEDDVKNMLDANELGMIFQEYTLVER